MSKKVKISCIILIIMIITSFANCSRIYATSHSAGEIVNEAEGFISKGENGSSKIKTSNLQDMSNTLYNILLIFGIIIAIIVGLILGIKYLIGGLEGQVEVKKMMVAYVIGCVILFGSFTIWKIIVTVLQG